MDQSSMSKKVSKVSKDIQSIVQDLEYKNILSWDCGYTTLAYVHCSVNINLMHQLQLIYGQYTKLMKLVRPDAPQYTKDFMDVL